MSNKISNERKTTYYFGLALTIIGIILFMVPFFSVFIGFGLNEFGAGIPMSFGIGFLGFIMVAIGGFLRNLGAKGAAGSGLILDPEKAREDLKPYSSAAGGMISDVVENIDMDKIKSKSSKEEVIKVRCRSCGKLNDEDASFCKSCGERL